MGGGWSQERLDPPTVFLFLLFLFHSFPSFFLFLLLLAFVLFFFRLLSFSYFGDLAETVGELPSLFWSVLVVSTMRPTTVVVRSLV